jgi:hypothetical protein
LDRKDNHIVKDCIRPIKFDKGKAKCPKAMEYQKMKVARLESFSEEESSTPYSESSGSGSFDLESDDADSKEEVSEGEYWEEQQQEQQEENEERNWWDSPSGSEYINKPH